MPPKVGPILYSVRGIAQQAIAAGATLGPVLWKWPRAQFCSGIWLITASGSPADAAKLSIRLQDETAHDVFTDGQGTTLFAPVGPMMSLEGGRILPLQRPVADGDEWFFSIKNAGADPITVAALLLLIQPALRAA